MIIDTIVSDMDDTLLNEHTLLSDYTLQVLGECVKRGIRVIPASGRTRSSLRPYVEQLHTGMPYIGGNGTEIIGADHEMLEQLVIPADLLREICAFFENRGMYIHVYDEERFFYSRECPASVGYVHSSGLTGCAVGDLVEFIAKPSPKALVIDEPEKIRQVWPEFEKQFGDKVTITQSKPYFLEIVAQNASKGEALKRLMEMLDLDPEKVLVFGDSLNDLPMITLVPNGVAMGNAREQVKAAARYVCLPNTQDGVARFVQKYVLENEEVVR